MKTHILSALAAAGILLRAQVAPDAESWPRSYTVDGADVVLYEPRIEKWQGSALDARFAIGIKLKSGDEAVYGSFAAHAEALANTETRTVTLFNFSASDVKFPDAPDKLADITRIINALAPEKPVKVSLDQLLAGVPSEDVITKTTVTTPAPTKAPKVIVRFENTVLLAFDGKPVFRSIPDTGLAAAVNTPATLLRPENGGPLYLLTNEGLWLQAAGWAGPWSAAKSPLPGLDRIPADHPVAQAVKNTWPPVSAVVSVPEVVTSETPTELIQIDGKPKYDRVGELPLVRVNNTDSPLFYHFDQGVFYVLISGRWFISVELTGPWTYVSHNELPAEFGQIPTDDPSADVRASIAGTREAEEAAKEAQIPTYARVNVREAPQINVEYDGEPVFDDVSGTNLSYAINTTSAVVCVGGLFYCCQDGLWFVADAPAGAPWRCATVVPQEIYLMPPSCPLYHTRFCQVESYDDDSVLYSCTPGYWGTYVDSFSNVCVYGTGWSYPAYISRNYYCGHSWTYGLGCRYVPRCGFVRECDRVAHTGWFRHTGRGSALCRADSERWGGRFEREHWRSSSGRNVAFSSWNGRVATRSDEVAKSIHHRQPDNHAVPHHAGSKPQVVSRSRSPEFSSANFDKDVKAGQHGEIYRHGTEGWQRRDSGQWKAADKAHPVDPRVAESHQRQQVKKEKPPIASTTPQGFSREHRSTPTPSQVFNLEKGRAPQEALSRESGTRSGQPAHTADRKGFALPKQDSRPERDASRADSPPAHSGQRETAQQQPGVHIAQQPPSRANREPTPQSHQVEHHETPPQMHRAAPRQIEQPRPQPQPQVRRDAPHIAPKVEHRETPPQIHREAPRQIEQPRPQPQPQVHREAPHIAPKVEHREAPPQMHREAPRQIEQPRPQPQPQVHREAPRQIEQPRPQPRQDHGSPSHDSRSHRGDEKKDDKKR